MLNCCRALMMVSIVIPRSCRRFSISELTYSPILIEMKNFLKHRRETRRFLGLAYQNITHLSLPAFAGLAARHDLQIALEIGDLHISKKLCAAQVDRVGLASGALEVRQQLRPDLPVTPAVFLLGSRLDPHDKSNTLHSLPCLYGPSNTVFPAICRDAMMNMYDQTRQSCFPDSDDLCQSNSGNHHKRRLRPVGTGGCGEAGRGPCACPSSHPDSSRCRDSKGSLLHRGTGTRPPPCLVTSPCPYRMRHTPLPDLVVKKSSSRPYIPQRRREQLEVELVDVGSVENGGWAQQHHVIRADGIAAQFACRERLALYSLDLALYQQGGNIVGQVAQVAGVPQLETLDRAIFHVLAQLIRRSQTGQSHLSPFFHRFDRAGCRGDTYSGGRDDALEVGILLQQGQRVVEAGLVIVVAIGDLDQFHIRVLRRQFILHEADPGVLVRGGAGCREYGDLACAIDLLGQQIDLAAANLFAIGLVDEHITRIGRDIGVIPHYLDPLRHGLFEGRRDSVGIIARDDDSADVLLGEARDERHLRGGIGRGRANLFELPAQGGSGLLASFGCRVEIRVVDLLGYEDDVEVAPAATRGGGSASSRRTPASAGRQHQQYKDEKTGYQCLEQLFHCLLLYTCFELPATRRRRVITTERRRARLGPSTERINSKPMARL